MGGFFGTVSQQPCITDLFYGTDYNSHLGTRRGGMATYCSERGFSRSIHNLENTYFRTRFEAELDEFHGNAGIGIISDTDAQPLLMNSHLGRFAIVTVARINNIEQLAQRLLDEGLHLSEFSSGRINPTELIALLIIRGRTFVEGIENTGVTGYQNALNQAKSVAGNTAASAANAATAQARADAAYTLADGKVDKNGNVVEKDKLFKFST